MIVTKNKELPNRSAGVAYVFCKASWTDAVGANWTSSWANACSLGEFERGAGSPPLVRLMDPGEASPDRPEDIWGPEPALGAMADVLKDSVGGPALKCEAWHGLAGELSHSIPIATLCLDTRERFVSRARAEEWGRSMRGRIGAWLDKLGVEHADFEFDQSAADWRDEAGDQHLADVRAWAASVQESGRIRSHIGDEVASGQGSTGGSKARI